MFRTYITISSCYFMHVLSVVIVYMHLFLFIYLLPAVISCIYYIYIIYNLYTINYYFINVLPHVISYTYYLLLFCSCITYMLFHACATCHFIYILPVISCIYTTCHFILCTTCCYFIYVLPVVSSHICSLLLFHTRTTG